MRQPNKSVTEASAPQKPDGSTMLEPLLLKQNQEVLDEDLERQPMETETPPPVTAMSDIPSFPSNIERLYPASPSICVHGVHVFISIFITVYLAWLVRNHQQVWPGLLGVHRWGMLEARCEKISLLSCTHILYAWPLTSVISFAVLLTARDARKRLKAIVTKFKVANEAVTLHKVSIRRRLAANVLLSLIWCAMLCYFSGVSDGLKCYLALFLPHHVSLAQGDIAARFSDTYINICQVRIIGFFGNGNFHASEEYSGAKFWYAKIQQYDELADFLIETGNAVYWLRVVQWILLAALLSVAVLIAMLSDNLSFVTMCSVASIALVYSFVRHLRSSARATHLCQSKSSRKSIVRKAAAQSYERNFVSDEEDLRDQLVTDLHVEQSVLRFLEKEQERSAYAQFMQHVALIPIGLKGPLLGTITKHKLRMMFKIAAWVLSVVTALHRFIDFNGFPAQGGGC